MNFNIVTYHRQSTRRSRIRDHSTGLFLSHTQPATA